MLNIIHLKFLNDYNYFENEHLDLLKKKFFALILDKIDKHLYRFD